LATRSKRFGGSVAEEAESTFSLNLDGNMADEAAKDRAALEALREQIHGSTASLREMQAAQRSLRGDTEQIKAARAALKAQIGAERDIISQANLALLKQGTTYEKVAGDAKKLAIAEANAAKEAKAEAAQLALLAKVAEANAAKEAKEQAEGLSRVIQGIGGPVASAVDGFRTLKDSVGAAGIGLGILTGIAVGAVAAFAALTAGVIAGGIAFGRWIIGAADAQRSLNLVREAATGSAEQARNLGTQVDALAAKLPTPKAELNDLASELARTRLSGQAIVDTFNAVGQASAALGDSVGRTLQDIITRGQRAGRISLTAPELQGTGIKFQDVAAELSKNLKVSVKDAQQALIEGRVKIDDGAKAIRAVVEKRFGEINARKLLSLETISEKLHETWSSLARDVRLEPLLAAMGKLASYFTDATVAGSAMHEIVTVIGNGLVKALVAAGPLAKAFLKGLVIGALDVTIALLKVRGAFVKAFPDDAGSKVSGVTTALQAAVAPLEVLAKTLDAVAKTLELGTKITGGHLGEALSAGLSGGIRAGFGPIASAALDAGKVAKDALAGSLEVHSPSKVGERIGRAVPDGVELGIRGGLPKVEAASVEMGDSAGSGTAAAPYLPPSPPSKGGSTVISKPEIHVHIHTSGGKDVAAQITAPSILDQLLKAVEEALKTSGVPTQTEPST
jgi:hypothetical protein